MNAPNLWTDNRAAVAVEFVLISIALFFFIFFMGDLVMRQALVGKLDRVSYSVSGVLRERIQFFEAREELSQQDVDATMGLAKRMLLDMHAGADLRGVSLMAEEMHFEDPNYPGDTSKRIKYYRSWRSGASVGECQPPQPLNKLMQLTPRGSYGRWVPLYQVTICLPTISWFSRLTTMGKKPMISSFSIVMAR